MCSLEPRLVPGGANLPRRKFLALLGCALSVPILARAAEKGPPPKPQNALSPDAAFNRLMEGNHRYVEGTMQRHDFSVERSALAHGQNPFACVLTCADSRVGPEYACDTGLGDIFVCRVAGNFADDDTIGSFEYGVANLGTPLIFVLGHQSCGGVTAAVEEIKDGTTFPGHISSLAKAIIPAVEAVRGQPGDLLTNAIKENVVLTVQKLQTTGPILAEAVDQKKIRVVGGVHNLSSGKVELVTS